MRMTHLLLLLLDLHLMQLLLLLLLHGRREPWWRKRGYVR
jgi:hypothetical protein